MDGRQWAQVGTLSPEQIASGHDHEQPVVIGTVLNMGL